MWVPRLPGHTPSLCQRPASSRKPTQNPPGAPSPCTGPWGRRTSRKLSGDQAGPSLRSRAGGTGPGHGWAPGPVPSVRESAPGTPGFPRTLSHRGTGSELGRGPPVGEVCHSLGHPQPSLPRRGEAPQHWSRGPPPPPQAAENRAASTGCLLSLPWPGPHPSPLHPGPPQGPSDPRPGAGLASGGPGGPRGRAGLALPRRVPPGAPCAARTSLRGFSTQNTSPREATGLMSWVCGPPSLPCGAPTAPSRSEAPPGTSSPGQRWSSGPLCGRRQLLG